MRVTRRLENYIREQVSARVKELTKNNPKVKAQEEWAKSIENDNKILKEIEDKLSVELEKLMKKYKFRYRYDSDNYVPRVEVCYVNVNKLHDIPYRFRDAETIKTKELREKYEELPAERCTESIIEKEVESICLQLEIGCASLDDVNKLIADIKIKK